MAQGYKTCPHCKAEVAGPRTKVCPTCGHSFGFKLSTTTGEPVIHTNKEGMTTRTVFSYPLGYTFPADKILQMIHIPAGSPPKFLWLPEPDLFQNNDALLQWASDVRQELIYKGQYIFNTGLIYWAKKAVSALGHFAPRGDEMRYVALVLSGLPDITTREIPV